MYYISKICIDLQQALIIFIWQTIWINISKPIHFCIGLGISHDDMMIHDDDKLMRVRNYGAEKLA